MIKGNCGIPLVGHDLRQGVVVVDAGAVQETELPRGVVPLPGHHEAFPVLSVLAAEDLGLVVVVLRQGGLAGVGVDGGVEPPLVVAVADVFLAIVPVPVQSGVEALPGLVTRGPLSLGLPQAEDGEDVLGAEVRLALVPGVVVPERNRHVWIPEGFVSVRRSQSQKLSRGTFETSRGY